MEKRHLRRSPRTLGKALRRGIHSGGSRPDSSIRLVPSLLIAISVAFVAPPTAAASRLPQSLELSVGSVTLQFPPEIRRTAEALADNLTRQPALPGLPADVLSQRPITVILVTNPASYDSLAPQAPDWSGGLAFPDRDLIVLPTFAPRAASRPLAGVLRHELAHIAVNRYLGPGVPRWFHEGYAQFAAGSWGAGQAWGLRLTFLAGKAPAFESLSLDFRRDQFAAEHAYWLAYTAVETLYRFSGEDGLTRFFQRWHDLGSIDLALRRTYGLTLGQYERLWRREVKSRYGWLLIMTQATAFWTALTILFLILGYWKRQRNKLKLEALEARVSLEYPAWDPEATEDDPDPRWSSGHDHP